MLIFLPNSVVECSELFFWLTALTYFSISLEVLVVVSWLSAHFTRNLIRHKKVYGCFFRASVRFGRIDEKLSEGRFGRALS